MFMQQNAIVATLFGVLFFVAALTKATAAPMDKAYGERYSPLPPVEKSQARVVYYRSGDTQKDAVNLYIDREFYNSLLPGGYTAFCVAAGPHLLGAFREDAPLYKGKREGGQQVDLKAGQQYFVRVAAGTAQVVPQKTATAELATVRKQIHAQPRASSVEACR